MGIDAATIQLASHQGGYVTRAQLSELGYSPSAIDRRIRAGELVAVSSGLYQVIPSGDHKDLLRGALLKLPDAVASHQSAAHLLDFPIKPKLVPTVTVHRRTTHTFPGVKVRRCDDLRPEHVTSIDGIRVTTIARAAFDLAAVLEDDEFAGMAEALLVDGRLKHRHLQKVGRALSRQGKPGSVRVQAFLEAREPGRVVEPTVLEKCGRQVLDDHGLPAPTPEFPIPWDPQRRFDDAYPKVRAAIEWDSNKWHTQVDAMRSDRRRDSAAAVHGWVVLRFTWADVTEEPDRVAAIVADVLASRAE